MSFLVPSLRTSRTPPVVHEREQITHQGENYSRMHISFGHLDIYSFLLYWLCAELH